MMAAGSIPAASTNYVWDFRTKRATRRAASTESMDEDRFWKSTKLVI